ncbi:MAG: PDZ domain-containing protein [Deltaproteobacteria bacterium]|nr:PDZ domain-containing protein [Deltaproteobacteria bacterium]
MRVRKFFPAIPFLFCLFFLAAQTAAESNQFDVQSEAVTVRPWLGVTVQDINEETAKTIGLENDKGVLVSGVVTGGPAGEAGLNPGDVILKLNGSEVEGAEEFASKIQRYPVGSIVSLDVNREGEVEVIRVVLDPMPGHSADSYDYEIPAFCPEGKDGCMDEKGQCVRKDSCPMKGEGCPMHRMKEGEKYDKMYLMAAQELDLSPDQAKKARALESDYRKKAIRAKADEDLAEVELKELLSGEPVILDKVRAKLNDVASKEAELKFIRIKAREDFKKILTDEQRQKLDKIMAQGQGRGMK